MIRPKFANNEFYHIYNRGVDKRVIFKEQKDFSRFVAGLFLFNDQANVENVNFFYQRDKHYGYPISIIGEHKRKLLVDILCFCLMPNHFHLILKQVVDGGISKFLQKLGIGYTNYFNIKQERSGVLFQGKFKAKHIDDDRCFKHLTRYIHLNPLKLIEPNWKEAGIKNWTKAKNFLESYSWSSYRTYIGQNHLQNFLNKDIVKEIFGSGLEREYADFVKGWTRKDLETISDFK